MKIRNRVLSIAIAAAAPAQAGTWGYSVGRWSQDDCVYAHKNAYREKINPGFTVDHYQPCTASANGSWNGYFQFG